MAKFAFTSLGTFHINGRGTAVYIVYTVLNPFECFDFSHLIGQLVLIDGEARKVAAVERYAHTAPWHKDEKIGLVVEGQADG